MTTNIKTPLVQNADEQWVDVTTSGQKNVMAVAGEHYTLVERINDEFQLARDVIVIRQGSDLLLKYSNEREVLIEDFYTVCAENECSVEVIGPNQQGYNLLVSTEGIALEGDSILGVCLWR